MEYIRRIVDSIIDKRSQAFNAINIVGPKGCGKTRTAKERCKTTIEFQDEEKREGYLQVAKNSPTLFFKNEKPILFDEWQDASKIWGAIRKECDDNPEQCGNYYLTGSSSRKEKTPHTGTGRISEITMYPMTVFETGESNGTVSLTELIQNNNYELDGKMSSLELEDLFYIVSRGGWPHCLLIKNKEAKLEVAKDYFRQYYKKDISSIDEIKRNEELARTILWSYARNMATTAKKTQIYADVQANFKASEDTISDYINAFERLYVIKEIDAWTPQIRSKTAIRSSKKHILVDPSIGLAALGITADYFINDLDLFGHAFENLVLRDLSVFAEAHDARLMHYRDDTGLEADAVFQMDNGEYALIEIKTSESAVETAEASLLKLKALIKQHNAEATANKEHPSVVYREPNELIIICAKATMAYTTENGVRVIPFGCIRD